MFGINVSGVFYVLLNFFSHTRSACEGGMKGRTFGPAIAPLLFFPCVHYAWVSMCGKAVVVQLQWPQSG